MEPSITIPAQDVPCVNCAGSGFYASLMTGWDGIRCDPCSGTGRISASVDERVAYYERRLAEGMEAIGAAVRKLEADGYFDAPAEAAVVA